MPQCFGEGRISVVDKRIREVDFLPAAFGGVKKLYLSHNFIYTLRPGIAQFPELRLLSAGDNPIEEVGELDHLAHACPLLEYLSLELCPIAVRRCRLTSG